MTNAAHLALFELLYEQVVFAQVELENLQNDNRILSHTVKLIQTAVDHYAAFTIKLNV